MVDDKRVSYLKLNPTRGYQINACNSARDISAGGMNGRLTLKREHT